jgi:diaminopimelate epimerase
MTYFNCDGRQGTLCGNGARCAVSFARSLGLLKYNEARFSACDGPHFALYDEINNRVHVKMNIDADIEARGDDFFINTGSPHLVRFISDDLDSIDVESIGRHLCKSEVNGANVNFVRKIADMNTVEIRTYVRGVFAETLACGTGAVAAALVHASRNTVLRGTFDGCSECGWDARHVHVKAKGGELAVAFELDAVGLFEEVFLIGPAHYVFSGTYTFTEDSK